MLQGNTSEKLSWVLWIALWVLWAASVGYDWFLHRWVSPISIGFVLIFGIPVLLWWRGARGPLTAGMSKDKALFMLGAVLAAAAILATQFFFGPEA